VLPEAHVWLVDGFNAIHTVLLGGQNRDEWWTEPVRDRLLERIVRFEDPSAEIWVVFDGSSTPDAVPESGAEAEAGHGPEVHIVFAPSADAWLVDRTRRRGDGAALGVVTADRKVAGRCRHAGAMVVAPRDFLAHCPSVAQRTS
jgi:predicted RNA-binding protein with PIN domain